MKNASLINASSKGYHDGKITYSEIVRSM